MSIPLDAANNIYIEVKFCLKKLYIQKTDSSGKIYALWCESLDECEENVEVSIRNKGLKKFVLGMLAGFVAGLFLYWLRKQGYVLNSFAMIVIAAPAAWGLVGLLEMVTSRPFSEMEDWWNGLRGWQRGVLGLLIVVIAFAFMMGAIGTAGVLGLI
ncbi:hypothetical protein KCM76_25405 [Zooshikella marina]|uniref:hypothetical protein n=1 Tax=Zooshikella ganghwensis TaxID=202772 RepID=UPI001BAF92CF|nr:hypothetical protein [Zooshikella ganghwensis]MBU2709358.1 hypothetical protein [Zooshikella ganghwensis]